MIMIEPFGVDYRALTQEPCPHCVCCTAALCRKGRTSVLECAGSTASEYKDVVTGCPCSAATTEGTAAWRDALVIAARQGIHFPLPEPAEELLRALARQEAGTVDPASVLALKLRRYVSGPEDSLVVTWFGRAYLAARDGKRQVTPVYVEMVDDRAGVARVIVERWSRDQAVTVLVAHLVCDTGLEAAALPGTTLEAVASLDATRAEEVIPADFRIVARPWQATPVVVRGEVAGGE